MSAPEGARRHLSTAIGAVGHAADAQHGDGLAVDLHEGRQPYLFLLLLRVVPERHCVLDMPEKRAPHEFFVQGFDRLYFEPVQQGFLLVVGQLDRGAQAHFLRIVVVKVVGLFGPVVFA